MDMWLSSSISGFSVDERVGQLACREDYRLWISQLGRETEGYLMMVLEKIKAAQTRRLTARPSGKLKLGLQ